jgi:hypothetical protein
MACRVERAKQLLQGDLPAGGHRLRQLLGPESVFLSLKCVVGVTPRQSQRRF